MGSSSSEKHSSRPRAMDKVMPEFPFLTITKFPPGFLVHLGGMVSSKSVKLLEELDDRDDSDAGDDGDDGDYSDNGEDIDDVDNGGSNGGDEKCAYISIGKPDDDSFGKWNALSCDKSWDGMAWHGRVGIGAICKAMP